MTKRDKEEIGLIVENAIHEAQEPVRALLAKHDQTLYGEDGRNGLKGDMRKVKDGISKIRILIATVTGGAVVVIAALKLIFNISI